MQDYTRLGVAGFLTEFGADSNGTHGLIDVQFIAGACLPVPRPVCCVNIFVYH